jgi:glycosyltransferase involved in cell wall biosynthesis
VEPVVSVVIPTFNRAGFLTENIDGVLALDGPAFEVIVVDDGSTDETPTILAGYGDRLRVVRQDNRGIAAARNAGVAVARGSYVAFHDSDDMVLPGRIALPYDYLLTHPGYDIAIGNAVFLPPPGSDAESRPWLKPALASALDGREVTFREVFRWNIGQLQATLISRASLDAIGPLNSEFLILDDLDVMLRLSLRFRAIFLDRPLFAYRQHGAGVTHNRMLLREESIRLAERMLGDHPEIIDRVGQIEYARRQARRYARLASMKLEAGDLEAARAAMDEACRLAPGNVAYRLQALAMKLRRR